MTIEDLSKISNVSLDTIRNKKSTIPGLISDCEDISFEPGTRFPFNPYRYKFNNREKRIDALLNATYRYRYVDETILCMEKAAFDVMINELLQAGLLLENGSENTHGANRYDTTILYSQIAEEKSLKRIKKITEIIASAAGHFSGAFVSEML